MAEQDSTRHWVKQPGSHVLRALTPADSVLLLLVEPAFSQTSAPSTACNHPIAGAVILYFQEQGIFHTLNFKIFPPRIHLVSIKEDKGFDDLTGAPVPW